MHIPAGITARFGRQLLSLQKSAPSLLFAGGVAGVTTSTVFACKATLRLEETLAETKQQLEQVKGPDAQKMINDLEVNYTESDRRRDTAVLYGQGLGKVTRLYGPSLILGALSIAMLTKSHNLLQQRNTALAAAYTALDTGFRRYRAQVVDKYGEEQDQEFRYASTRVQAKDPETGRKKTVSRFAKFDDEGIYEKVFDSSTSAEWHADADYRLHFLHGQQAYWNEMLRSRGHVFLNEVYKSLGLEHTKAGAVVGWVYESERGDSFIDFGLYEATTDRAKQFIHHEDGAMLLDFNVDGVIFDLLND